jgi:hypothetical protein
MHSNAYIFLQDDPCYRYKYSTNNQHLKPWRCERCHSIFRLETTKSMDLAEAAHSPLCTSFFAESLGVKFENSRLADAAQNNANALAREEKRERGRERCTKTQLESEKEEERERKRHRESESM